MAGIVEVRPLARSDDRRGFSCGEPDLDRFFEHYAGQNQFKLHLAVTYVALVDGRIVGFATVATGAIDADAVAADAANEIADALLDRASAADTYTVRQALRVLLARAGGKSSGSATNAPILRAIDDSKARITATVNADGDILTMTIDAT